MFGLKIFVRVQTFRRVPPVLPRNFCHPALGSVVPLATFLLSFILIFFGMSCLGCDFSMLMRLREGIFENRLLNAQQSWGFVLLLVIYRLRDQASISEGNSVPLSLNTKTYCTPRENKMPLEFSYWRRWTYFKHNDQLQLPFCHPHCCCFVLLIHSLDTESCHWGGTTTNGHFQDNNNRDQLCGDLNMHQGGCHDSPNMATIMSTIIIVDDDPHDDDDDEGRW